MAEPAQSPRALLNLACSWRPDWDREATWQAIHAAHAAGWTWERTVKRAVALMFREDGEPRELRDEACGTRLPAPSGPEVYARGGRLWRHALENRTTGPQPRLREDEPPGTGAA